MGLKNANGNVTNSRIRFWWSTREHTFNFLNFWRQNRNAGFNFGSRLASGHPTVSLIRGQGDERRIFEYWNSFFFFLIESQFLLNCTDWNVGKFWREATKLRRRSNKLPFQLLTTRVNWRVCHRMTIEWTQGGPNEIDRKIEKPSFYPVPSNSLEIFIWNPLWLLIRKR